MSSYIELQNVSQSFLVNQQRITLFQSLNLSLKQGHSYAITGPSGAGKSSLLMLASGLETPTTGNVLCIEHNQKKPLDMLRSDIGFIFQQFHLLPELTAINNVALPLKLRGDKDALDKAQLWLDKVGLGHRANHKPSELSGGEQQRVAIARALIFNPKFIFADEPTGNLDPKCAQEVAEILISSSREHNAGLVIVTHSELLAAQTEHIYSLANGELKQYLPEVASPAAVVMDNVGGA